MNAALRIVSSLETTNDRTEDAAVEDRARDVIDDLQRHGRLPRARALGNAGALRETLHVVGEFDLELLVRIAADAIEAAPADA